jgi:chorismate dehydratase
VSDISIVVSHLPLQGINLVTLSVTFVRQVSRQRTDDNHGAGYTKNIFLCDTKLNELSKIRIGAVSYLNTKPLLYGIKRSDLLKEIELTEEYPAKIAEQLLNDEIDIGLVPVAIIPRMKEYYIVSDYCIGAEGEVASVSLFSDVPVNQVQEVLLDYQSRTSVNLAKILLKDFWKVSPELVNADEDYIAKIKGTTAGVVIGDRALKQRGVSAYNYDLAAAWRKMTDLPFVFAAWIANKPMDKEFMNRFNQANAYGLGKIDEIVKENPFSHYDLHTYYTKNISYGLTADKKKGLHLFLKLLQG